MYTPALGPASSLYYSWPVSSPPIYGPVPLTAWPSPATSPLSASASGTTPASKPQSHKQAIQMKQGLKAAAFLCGAALINYSNLRPVVSKLASNIISSDWKDWAKVILGLAGIDAAEKAANWEPPVWLKAGLNVVLVTPFAVRLKPELKNVLKNFGQSAILAPFVSGLAAFNHIASEKVEQPLQENLNVPPLATRISFSILTTMLGLLTLPAVSRAITASTPKASTGAHSKTPKAGATKAQKESSRSGLVGGACACCPSMICINDLGQMGSTIIDSYQQKQTNQGAPAA